MKNCRNHPLGPQLTMVFKVGLLVISDTVSLQPQLDKTIPEVKKFFESYPNYQLLKTSIVSDSITEIQSQVTRWSELDLVITSGGTGFTKRDVTPDAIKPLIEKETLGITHLMLTHSLAMTKYAALGRLMSGIRGECLILCLPGSNKAVKQCLEGIIEVLGHGLEQLKVDSSRPLHQEKKYEEPRHGDHHHSHHHHHHERGHSQGHFNGSVKRHVLSNDLSNPVTERARSSPYPMIPVSDALDLINKHTPVSSTYNISISDPNITGSIIMEDIHAAINVPNFRASIVDGYAVYHDDGPGVYKVVQVTHASPGERLLLKKGEIARVTTGAPIPDGSTAVIPVEESELVSTRDDGNEENEVRILALDVEEGDNIREIGSDTKTGDIVLEKGTLISNVGGEIGLLASIGVTEVKVYKKPLIGILSTGDELVDLDDKKDGLRLGQIYDTNRPLLLNFFKNWGYEAIDLGIAKDTASQTETKIREAFDKVDYVITTGGVSMGELDLLKPIIEQKLNGVIHFGRVAMKPGKPTTFATVEHKGITKLIFALPGNPASASVTTHLFVLPSLRRFQGYTKPDGGLPTLNEVKVTLKETVKLDPRPEYHRVTIHQEGDQLVASTTGFQRSSRVGSMSGSNGLLVLPSSNETGITKLKKGTRVSAIVIGLI